MSDLVIRPDDDAELLPSHLRGEGGAGVLPDALLPDDRAAPTDPEAVPMLAIPYGFARRHGVVLQPTEPDAMPVVALREGADARVLIEVRRYLARAFDVAIVAPAAFDRLLSDAYAMDGQATAMAAVGMGDELDMLAEGLPTAEDLLDTADDAPAIRLINGIIADAARNGVSDIHIEPYETGLVVRMRIDGVLRETLRMPPHVAPVVVSRIKVMARLDIAERRVPQDGRRRSEALVLAALMVRNGALVRRETLEARVYGYDKFVTGNSLESTISRLRKALATKTDAVKVSSVRGVGYQLVENPPS